MGPRGEDSNERAYSATRRTNVVSTPATEPRTRSLLSGSTIVSVLMDVMFSGLSGRLDAMTSHSSEDHSRPSNRVQSKNAPRMEGGAQSSGWLGRTSLSTVSGVLIQFSGIVAV
jgi:hypothetical protein